MFPSKSEVKAHGFTLPLRHCGGLFSARRQTGLREGQDVGNDQLQNVGLRVSLSKALLTEWRRRHADAEASIRLNSINHSLHPWKQLSAVPGEIWRPGGEQSPQNLINIRRRKSQF